MPAERFIEQLNEQIANEFAAHQQFLAVAVYYDTQIMPETASFFYRLALHQRRHAMRMIRYLTGQGAETTIPGIAAPAAPLDSVLAPAAFALEQAKRVTDQINLLTRIARDEEDFASEAFTQRFVRDQVDEVSDVAALVTVIARSKENLQAVEDYLRRR